MHFVDHTETRKHTTVIHFVDHTEQENTLLQYILWIILNTQMRYSNTFCGSYRIQNALPNTFCVSYRTHKRTTAIHFVNHTEPTSALP